MYNEMPQEQLNKETLLQDDNFLVDASEFLRKRTGQFYTEPEEVFDAYLNHMRWHSTNDVTPFRDLRFAQDADPDMKARMARLFQTYDAMEVTANDDIVEAGKAFMDFSGSILASPSTWVGLLTSGAGKVASLGAQKAARVGVRGLIYKATEMAAKRPIASGALAGATVEGTAAYSTERARQMGRVETGAQAEEDDTATAINTLVGTLAGGTAGALIGRGKAKQVEKANKFFADAMKAESELTEQAAKVADETITANKNKADAVIDRLKPLKEENVQGGREIKEGMMSNNELLMLSMDIPVKKSITAAAIELLGPEDLAKDSTKRITEIVAERMANGTLTTKGIQDIAEKYNLSTQQMSLIFTADISDAARSLQLVGQIKKSLMKEQTEQLAKNMQSIANKTEGKGVSFTEEQIDEINMISKSYDLFTKESTGFLRGFERMRRAFLTSQVQTTVRNFAGGGARVILDMPEKLFENVIKKTVNTIAGKEVYADDQIYSALSIAKYISPISVGGENRVMADIVSNMFARANPESAQRLFGTFMDGTEVARKAKLGTALESVGASMNFANRFSDNYFKKAIFTGELDRLVRAKHKKSLLQMLEEGRFKEIDNDMFSKATNKAFELLYQKKPDKGTFGDFYLNKLDKHWGAGIVAGMLIPFPRFVFNSIEFMYDHAPVIGLINSKTFSKEAPERIAKQITGTSMVYFGYMHSASQGTEKQWYMHINENGEETDLRPFLGPMALPMYLGDLLNRHWDSSKPMQDNVSSITSNVDYGTLGELLFGSSFRVGAGAYFINGALPQFAEVVALPDEASDFQKSQALDKAMGRFAGDYVATLAYNMPTAIARDIYKITDEEARMIGPGDEVLFGDVFRARASRALPQPLKEKVLAEKEKGSVLAQRYVVTSDKPVKTLDPFSTAVTGLSRSRKSSRLEKELAKIGYTSYDIYKPLKFGPADVLVRRELSGNSNVGNPSLTEYINRTLLDTTEYNNADISAKRSYLKYATSQYVQQIIDDVYEDLENRLDKKEIDYTKAEIYRNHFEAKPKESQKAALAAFRKEAGRRPDLENEEDLYAVVQLAIEMTKQFGSIGYAKGGLVQSFSQGGDVVGRTRAGQPIYDSGVDDQTRQMVELGLDLAPVTGEIRSAQAAVEDFEKGDYGMAALGALGALPGVGIVGRGAKAGVKAVSKYADDLWDAPTQKVTSADTSINSSKLPAGYTKLKKMGAFKPGQRVVDIGGGRFDNAVEDLAKQDVELQVYDPFNRTPDHNKAVKELVADGGADVAVSNNTLNVIEEPENIKRVIQQAENAIKPGDKAYFTVYAGDGSGKGKITSKGYQRNEPTSDYVSRVEEVFGKGNVQIKGDLITATKNDAGLPLEDAAKKYSPSDLGMSGDKTFYHGTTGDLGGFDLKKSDLGIHIGGNPKQAMLRLKAKGNLPKDLDIDEYPEGANIIPLVARIKNPLETTDLGHWNDVLTVLRGPNPLYKQQQMNSYRNEIAQGKYINPKILADGITDIAVKKGFKKENIKKLIDIEDEVWKIADKNDWKGPLPYKIPDDLMTQAKFAQSPRSKELLAEIREILADEGYDSIKYENLHERGTPSPDDDLFSYIVLDTSQLRVPWAKFDPKNKSSGELNKNRGGLMSRK